MTTPPDSTSGSPQSRLHARRAYEDSSSERASKRLFTRQDDASQFQRGTVNDTDASNHLVFVPTPIITDMKTNTTFSLQPSDQPPSTSDVSFPSTVPVPDLSHMWAPSTSPILNESQSPPTIIAKHEDNHSLHSLGGFKRANASPRVRYHTSIASHATTANAASTSTVDIEDHAASPVDSRKDTLPRLKQWVQLLPVRYGYPRLALYSLVSLFAFLFIFRFLLAAQPSPQSPYAVAPPEAYDPALAMEVQSLKQSDELADGSMQSMIEKLDNVVYKSVRRNGGAVAAAAAAAGVGNAPQGSEHAVLHDIINAKPASITKGVAGISDVSELPHAMSSPTIGEEPSAPHSLDEMPSMLSNMIIPLPNTPEAAEAAKAAAAAAKAKEKKAEQERLRAKNAEKKAHQASTENKEVQSHLTELTEKRNQALQQAAAAAAAQEKSSSPSSSSKNDKDNTEKATKEKGKEKEKEKKAKQEKEKAAKKKKEQEEKNKKKKKGPKVRSLEDLEAMRAVAATIRSTPLSSTPFTVPPPSAPGLIFDEDVVFIIPTKSFRHAQIARGILSGDKAPLKNTWGSLVKNPTVVFSNEYAWKAHGFRTQILTAPHTDWTPLDNRYNSWRMMQMANYLYEGMHTPSHPEYDRLQKVQFVIWLGDGTFPLLDQIKKKLDAFRAQHGGSYPLYAGGPQMKANFYKAFWPNQQGKAHNLYKSAPFTSSVSWMFGTSREFIQYVAEFANVDKCPLPIGDDKAIAALLICAGGISEEMKSRIIYDFFTLEKKAPKQALGSDASLEQWRQADAYNGLSNTADVAEATERYYVKAGLLQS